MTWTTDEYVEPGPKPLWRRKRWWVAGAVAAIVLAMTIYIVLGQGAVAKQLAAIRARGEPTTLEEMAAYYPRPPVEQDATQLWLAGAKSLAAASGTLAAKKLPILGEADAPPLVGQPWAEHAMARQFLQDNAQAMEKLHAAAALGGQARFPIDFRGGIAMLLPHVQELRTASRALMLEANVRAHDGDLHGAAESLRTGLLLSQSLKDEPTLVSQLVRIAIHSTVIDQWKRIGSARMPAADLERLQETLAQIEFADSMHRAVVAERVFGLAVFDDATALGLPTQVHHLLLFNRRADELAYLKLMGEFIAATELPWDECVAQIDEWSLNLSSRQSRWHLVTSALTPALGTVGGAFGRAETLNRLAIVDVAIARRAQPHGRPPAELAALAPELLEKVPLDPTTDRPFKYKVTADGYVLYSPTQLFLTSGGPRRDPGTGANPVLVFRQPPLPDEPKAGVAEPNQATDEANEAPAEAATEELKVD